MEQRFASVLPQLIWDRRQGTLLGGGPEFHSHTQTQQHPVHLNRSQQNHANPIQAQPQQLPPLKPTFMQQQQQQQLTPCPPQLRQYPSLTRERRRTCQAKPSTGSRTKRSLPAGPMYTLSLKREAVRKLFSHTSHRPTDCRAKQEWAGG